MNKPPTTPERIIERAKAIGIIPTLDEAGHPYQSDPNEIVSNLMVSSGLIIRYLESHSNLEHYQIDAHPDVIKLTALIELIEQIAESGRVEALAALEGDPLKDFEEFDPETLTPLFYEFVDLKSVFTRLAILTGELESFFKLFQELLNQQNKPAYLLACEKAAKKFVVEFNPVNRRVSFHTMLNEEGVSLKFAMAPQADQNGAYALSSGLVLFSNAEGVGNYLIESINFESTYTWTQALKILSAVFDVKEVHIEEALSPADLAKLKQLQEPCIKFENISDGCIYVKYLSDGHSFDLFNLFVGKNRDQLTLPHQIRPNP